MASATLRSFTDEVSLLDSGIVDSTGMLEVILFLEGEYAFHILLVKKPTPWSRRTYTVTRAHDDDSVGARRPCKQPNEPPGGMKVAHTQLRDRSGGYPRTLVDHCLVHGLAHAGPNDLLRDAMAAASSSPSAVIRTR